MTDAITSAGHLDDGALLRHVDGQCEADERTRLASHLRECVTCRGRARELARLAETLDDLLATRGSATRPAPRVKRIVLRVALVVLVCGAAVASAQPLRHWLAERFSSSGAAASAAGASPSAAAAGAPHAAVSFVPSGDRIELRFTARQAGGELVLAASPDSAMTFAAESGTPTPAVTVLPAGMVVTTSPDGHASYRATVPRSASEITVRIGDAAPRTIARVAIVDRGTIAVSMAGGS